MTTAEYLQSLHSRLCLGQATEHTYRGDLPSLDMEIVEQVVKGLGLAFVPEREEGNVCFAENREVRPEYRQSLAPIDLLDYIYAMLHSPTYRETYKEFLKIEFPRVPYPTDADKFWELLKQGAYSVINTTGMILKRGH